MNIYYIDLLTTDIPYNKPKVSLKLHELEYKLDVEKKVLTGIKTMSAALERDPSNTHRQQRGEVQGQLYESIEKRNLLDKALKKYKGLYIGEGDEDDYGKVPLFFLSFFPLSMDYFKFVFSFKTILNISLAI